MNHLSFAVLCAVFIPQINAKLKIVTPLYGGSGGGEGSGWKYNPISQMITWSTAEDSSAFPVAITNFKWQYQNGEQLPVTGTAGSEAGNPCTPFSLASNEYINSYRVQSGDALGQNTGGYVYGLEFQTTLGNTYSCGGAATNNPEDSGLITHDGYFLAGIKWRGGFVFDAVGFCFINIEFLNSNIPQNIAFCSFQTPPPTPAPTENTPAPNEAAPSDDPTANPTISSNGIGTEIVFTSFYGIQILWIVIAVIILCCLLCIICVCCCRKSNKKAVAQTTTEMNTI
eukprot:499473_1